MTDAAAPSSPVSGGNIVPPATWISGSAASRDSSSLEEPRRRSTVPIARARQADPEREAIVRLDAGRLRSTVWKLRSVRPAPTSSIDVSATSTTMRPKRNVRLRLTGLGRLPSAAPRDLRGPGATPAAHRPEAVIEHATSVKCETGRLKITV
jgi:hypothetical protein